MVSLTACFHLIDYYYALRTREEEKDLESPKLNWRELLLRKKNAANAGTQSNGNHDPAKDHTEVNFANKENRLEITDREWVSIMYSR